MRPPRVCAKRISIGLALLASFVCLPAWADNPFATHRNEVSVEYGRIDGPGAQADAFSRNVQTIDEGDRRALRIALGASGGFSFALGFSREKLQYSSPLRPGCQPDAWFFFRFLACQPVILPRAGVTRDKAETLSVDLRYHRELTSRLHIDTHLGYGRLSWQTRNDVEAIAVGRCLSIDSRFDLAPLDRLRNTLVIPECVPTAGSNVKSGLHGGINLSYRIAGPVWLAGGYTLQRYAYVPYRHLAYNRFREANGGCDNPETCVRAGWYLANISGSHPRTSDFFTAGVGSQLGKQFYGTLSYEFGGSRDWKALSSHVSWRF